MPIRGRMKREDFKDFIAFSKRERQGILLLFFLVLVSTAIRIVCCHVEVGEKTDFTELEQRISLLMIESTGLNEEVANEESRASRFKNSAEKPIELFPFNPNHIGLAEWKRLGLSERQAGSILKWREKGGVFRVKADVERMYTVSPELYKQWFSSIQLPEKLPQNENSKFNSSGQDEIPMLQLQELTRINLNVADSTELLTLPGIGPFYAGKIVEFREQLGGFVSIDQLMALWNMTPEKIEGFADRLEINLNDVHGLPINTLSADSLSRHPYITYKQAKVVVNYRKQHGPLNGTEDLKKVLVLSESDIEKIAPYLSFHD